MSGSTLSVKLSTHARCASLEDLELAALAASGDGAAFAELYGRYERKAFNFCYRLTGSTDDAADATQQAFLSVLERLPSLERDNLNFPAYLLTVARHASYRLMEKRKRSEPTDSIPEPSSGGGGSIGSGGGGWDPVDPHDDPERAVMLDSQQEEIRAANERLPERQREALALRELENLSYDEIAEIMGMNRNSVAQLISRARISLRDELRSSALLSIAAVSPECERALPLISMRQDGQLESSSDAEWLDAHLATCSTCRTSQEAMEEAGQSYRAWMPVAPMAWLFDETMAKAAELVGADWSDIPRPDSEIDGGDHSDQSSQFGKDGTPVTGPALQRLARRFGFAGVRGQRKGFHRGGLLGLLLLLAVPLSLAMAVMESGPFSGQESARQQSESVEVSAPEGKDGSTGNGDGSETSTLTSSEGAEDVESESNSSSKQDKSDSKDRSDRKDFAASLSTGADTEGSSNAGRVPRVVAGGPAPAGNSNDSSDSSSESKRPRTNRRSNLTTPSGTDKDSGSGGSGDGSTGSGDSTTGSDPATTVPTNPTDGSTEPTSGREPSGGDTGGGGGTSGGDTGGSGGSGDGTTPRESGGGSSGGSLGTRSEEPSDPVRR